MYNDKYLHDIFRICVQCVVSDDSQRLLLEASNLSSFSVLAGFFGLSPNIVLPIRTLLLPISIYTKTFGGYITFYITFPNLVRHDI